MTEQVPDDEINPEERKISSNRAKWKSAGFATINDYDSKFPTMKSIQKKGKLARIELNGKGSRIGNQK